jgi:outer membrane protein OmpA-like peptidoglycan-associated protein
MNKALSRAGIGGIFILATLSLGACATEEYVDKQIAGVQSQLMEHAGRISTLESQNGAQDAHLAKLDQQVAGNTSQIAANAKTAAGKFNYQSVGMETVSFDTAKFTLDDANKMKLNDLASRLKGDDKNVFLEINGYADPRGGKMYNYKLAAKRAIVVYDYLRDQGIPLNRMDLGSHGENAPIGEVSTQEDLARNRVVVINMVQ